MPMIASVPGIISRFKVTVLGKGTQPLMFAHGFGCTQAMWRYIYPAFENDYRIILFDYINKLPATEDYNRERYSSLDGYVTDILEIAEALALKDIIFVGHSISSMIGMLASIKQPDLFAQLIMLAPSPRYINDKEYNGGIEPNEADEILYQIKHNLKEWASAFSPQIMGSGKQSQLSEELRKSLCESDPDILFQFSEITFRSDFRDELQHVKVPTLILQGAKDIIAPVHIGQYMKDKIANSILYRMRAEGHYAHLSNPNETIELIKRYLAGLDNSSN